MKLSWTMIVAPLAMTVAACAGKPQPLGGAPEVTVLAADALPAPDGSPATTAKSVYRVGGGDRLLVDVVGIDALKDRQFETDFSGQLSIPIAGRVDAAGLTLDELESAIRLKLRRAYVRNPQVTVNPVEISSQRVTVDGSVKEPGLYAVREGMTLQTAVAQAKGLTEFAKLDDVVVFRTVQDRQMVALYNLGAIRRGAYGDPPLFAGDVVVVGESEGRRMFQRVAQVGSLVLTPIIALLNILPR